MRRSNRSVSTCAALAAALLLLAPGCSDSGGSKPADQGVKETSTDGPKPDGPAPDGPAGDGPAADGPADGPPAGDQGGSDITPFVDGLMGQNVPSPTPAKNPSDPWDAANNQQDGHNETLATAWPVGVVTPSTNDPYVQVITGTRGIAFFVFEAGAGLTSFKLNLNANIPPPPPATSLKGAHLHSVVNGKFDAAITPTTSSFTPSLASYEWPVTPGNTYVLEIATTGSGFV
ncbi:MAG: hypothetical protein KC503_05635 [Myxococcales bacterium]|nr:hypothetical protein [Myxococcales bacterium]